MQAFISEMTFSWRIGKARVARQPILVVLPIDSGHSNQLSVPMTRSMAGLPEMGKIPIRSSSTMY